MSMELSFSEHDHYHHPFSFIVYHKIYPETNITEQVYCTPYTVYVERETEHRNRSKSFGVFENPTQEELNLTGHFVVKYFENLRRLV